MSTIKEWLDKRKEENIKKGLERSYQIAKSGINDLSIDQKKDKIIIFSDQHKGMRDKSDDFLDCEKAYSAALGYYLELGYTLIVLGDSEELWECGPKQVIKSYRDVLQLEAEFHKQNRYYKISGNHDDFWENASKVKKYLDPVFGKPVNVTENLRILYRQSSSLTYEFFLVHGHQGDFINDRRSKLGKFLVHNLWRPFQRLTGFKHSTPATDFELRDRHGRALYSWAESRKELMLIAGHTHKPVFDVNLIINSEFQNLGKGKSTLKTAETRAEMELAKARVRATGQAIADKKPCYFNTGCCCFRDGDVTGIDISGGTMKLVRWLDDEGNAKPKVLEECEVKAVFGALGG